MNISIIIPNYNGEKLLEHNLPRVFSSIDDYKDGFVEVIVVDDGSRDSSMRVLTNFAEHYKNLTVLANESNYGFSTTVNRGVTNAKGDVIILLNTDVIPHDGFLKKVVTHFTDKKVFAVGFMDKSIEGEKTVLRGRGVIRWYRGFVLHEWGNIDNQRTLWVSGGSGAFRKKTWDLLGGFNELYNPFYWEDIDLSYRGIKSGYTIYFDKEITTVHEHDKGAIKMNNNTSRIEIYAYRNQFLFFWLNISDTSLWMKHLLWLPLHSINAVRDKNFSFFKGFFQAVICIPAVFFYRLKNRKAVILSDKDILHQYHT
jgi:GT2 family glycosyltransferase